MLKVEGGEKGPAQGVSCFYKKKKKERAGLMSTGNFQK